MHDNLLNCKELTSQILQQEYNPFRKAALEHVATMLDQQKAVISAKLEQLEMFFNGGGEINLAGDEPVNETAEKESVECKLAKPVEDSHAQARKLTIESTIISRRDVCFEDVAGLTEAKQALIEAIVLPLKFPHLFTGKCKPWQRILLYGPPGTGKSRLAQAVASEINSTFYSVSSADLLSSWIGESEKLIKDLFQHAVTGHGRAVVFIDEIDSICRARRSSEEEYSRRIKTELLKQMEGVNNGADDLILLCATNCPWELDTAFLRRFQKRIYAPLPDQSARMKLMQIHTHGHSVQMTDRDWQQLAAVTAGYSGSDLANIMLNALYEPIRELQEAQYWVQCSDGTFKPCERDVQNAVQVAVTSLPPEKVIAREPKLEDFLKSLKNYQATVSTTELLKFEDFANSSPSCSSS